MNWVHCNLCGNPVSDDLHLVVLDSQAYGDLSS